MNFFSYQGGALCAEKVPLVGIAKEFGTPTYVYSRAALEHGYREFSEACSGRDVLICYSVKANSNLAVLNLLARLGSGFDIVSGGELARVLAAGGSAAKTVFSGVGKSAAELRLALEAGVLCFNVESEGELDRLAAVAAEAGKIAPVSLRINPDVDPKTHPYIATGLRESKFGIACDAALPLYRKAARSGSLRIVGIDVHIGSQITDVEPFVAALGKMLEFVDVLRTEGVPLDHLDLGGGLGIRYRDEKPPALKDYLERLFGCLGGRKLRVLFEPGRSLVGNTGLLLTRVEYLKHGSARNFAVVDAAMNDLLRPALYDAWHEVLPVTQREGPTRRYDIVGPVCESADFLAKERMLAVEPGDLLAVMSAGAYGMSMSSNYNSRPRPPEVVADGAKSYLVRDRERAESLFASERLLP
ncbi:MAG TPA: diaminopimelate decarboxylase [Burkholderiales bacterium]|nr:diaminopimelate decarboxylase [Burkholderiales bacterium]